MWVSQFDSVRLEKRNEAKRKRSEARSEAKQKRSEAKRKRKPSEKRSDSAAKRLTKPARSARAGPGLSGVAPTPLHTHTQRTATVPPWDLQKTSFFNAHLRPPTDLPRDSQGPPSDPQGPPAKPRKPPGPSQVSQAPPEDPQRPWRHTRDTPGTLQNLNKHPNCLDRVCPDN